MVEIMKIEITKKHLLNLKKNKINFRVNGSQRLEIGQSIHCRKDLLIEPYCAFLQGFILCNMGSFSYSWSNLKPNMKIGRYCSIARNLKFQGINHPMGRFTTSSITYDENFIITDLPLSDYPESIFKTSPIPPVNKNYITIGNDVWIGADVTLAQGIQIGSGAVIGSNALVTKDVPPYAVVGGVPAKIIKYRFSKEIIDKLLTLEWWKYGFWDFAEHNLDDDISKFIEVVEKKISNGTLTQFTPEPLSYQDLIG